jgi:hypothetical protein
LCGISAESEDEVEDEVEVERDQGVRSQESAILHYPTHSSNRHPEATRFSVWPKDLRYLEIKTEIEIKSSGVRNQQFSILLFVLEGLLSSF